MTFQAHTASAAGKKIGTFFGRKVTASVLNDAVVAAVNTDGTVDIITPDGARLTVPGAAVQLRDEQS